MKLYRLIQLSQNGLFFLKRVPIIKFSWKSKNFEGHLVLFWNSKVDVFFCLLTFIDSFPNVYWLCFVAPLLNSKYLQGLFWSGYRVAAEVLQGQREWLQSDDSVQSIKLQEPLRVGVGSFGGTRGLHSPRLLPDSSQWDMVRWHQAMWRHDTQGTSREPCNDTSEAMFYCDRFFFRTESRI